jgi:phosphate:Na+ symporter
MPGTELFASLLGSVALLLWGVRMVRTGMTRAFGSTLRQIVATSTKTRARAFFVGLAVTGLLQSSTATAVLLASFAARGLIVLPAALVMMLGANIGTTLTAQLFAFDVTWFWTLAVAPGVLLFTLTAGDKTRASARIGIGFGLMLLSLIHLKDAAAPLEHSPAFTSVLSGLADNPILGFLVATALAWLMHSSLTMILFVMALAAANVLPLPLALALVLGANVGAAIAPFSALIGSPPVARGVAAGNLLMRLAVAWPFLFLLGPSLALLETITSNPGHLILNFHTVQYHRVASIFALRWACGEAHHASHAGSGGSCGQRQAASSGFQRHRHTIGGPRLRDA